MLIAFAGLPGTGKTSIARELARRLHATYLRIDTIEQAIVSCGNIDPIMEEGGSLSRGSGKPAHRSTCRR